MMRRWGWLRIGHEDGGEKIRAGMGAPIIATAGTAFWGRVAIGGMGGADEAGAALAVDKGVAEEGEMTACCVSDKPEQTMTHATTCGVTDLAIPDMRRNPLASRRRR